VSNSGLLYRTNKNWTAALNYVSQMQVPRITPMGGPYLGCVKVVYVGGYDLVPADLKQAIFQIVQDRKAAINQGEKFAGEGFEGYSYSLGTPDTEVMRIGSVMRTLSNYKRTNIIL
jgi:hypothetical protein